MEQGEKIFVENPFDLETTFEALTIASLNGQEFVFLDQFITELRDDPCQDLTKLNYRILQNLQLLTLEDVES